MLGRGLDQVLPRPGDPELHERYVLSAETYVDLAERAHGPIPTPVDFAYPWGDALAELDLVAPDARIVNLETAITTSQDWAPKGINYRMHPGNVACLEAARVDCCVLANNHVLDWGPAGLVETLETLCETGIDSAGAGREETEARRPAVIPTPAGRVMVFAFALEDSGVPPSWCATPDDAGVWFLPGLSDAEADRVIASVSEQRRDDDGDVVVASIHWGGNWGYPIPRAQRRFAHRLVESGVVDVIHGHSSHHAKAVEVHAGKPILYGCGDFLNDYEGIEGYEPYRDDLALMYFVTMSSGRLVELRMFPLRIRRFRLERAPEHDVRWLKETLERESARFGTHVVVASDGALRARWEGRPASAVSAGSSRG